MLLLLLSGCWLRGWRLWLLLLCWVSLSLRLWLWWLLLLWLVWGGGGIGCRGSAALPGGAVWVCRCITCKTQQQYVELKEDICHAGYCISLKSVLFSPMGRVTMSNKPRKTLVPVVLWHGISSQVTQTRDSYFPIYDALLHRARNWRGGHGRNASTQL